MCELAFKHVILFLEARICSHEAKLSVIFIDIVASEFECYIKNVFYIYYHIGCNKLVIKDFIQSLLIKEYIRESRCLL